MAKVKAKRAVDESLMTPEDQDRVAASLPNDLPDLGAIDGVGQVPFSFGVSPVVWLVTGVLAVFFAVMMYVGLTLNPLPPEKATIETAVKVIAIGAGVFGVLGLAFAAFLAARPKLRRGERWVFFRRALVRLNWGRATVFPWPDLAIRKTSADPANTRYELTGHGGKPVKLWYGLIGSRVLVLAIQGRHAEMVLPALSDRVRRGEEAQFGKVGLTTGGIRYKKKQAAWDEVEALEFAVRPDKGKPLGMVVRTTAGKWDVNLSEDVPNAWVMVELICALQPRLVKKHWDEFHGQVA